jgi:hypothetical protein
VAAEFHDGVLEATVPKPEQRKPRRIPIGAADDSTNGNGPATIEGSAAER